MTGRARLARAPHLVVERSCCACRTRRLKQDLIRLARTPAGAVVLDPAGMLPGRGSYVCRSVDCIEAALRRGRLAWSLRTSLSPDHAAVLRRQMLGYLESSEWQA
jgi:predicted RNA-binding protein YlxR (DUF448 family)